MANVISEIEISKALRSRLMGGRGEQDQGRGVRVRLVLVGWQTDAGVRAPQVVAEISKRVDALGGPVWEDAGDLPHPLLFAALGLLLEAVPHGELSGPSSRRSL